MFVFTLSSLLFPKWQKNDKNYLIALGVTFQNINRNEAKFLLFESKLLKTRSFHSFQRIFTKPLISAIITSLALNNTLNKKNLSSWNLTLLVNQTNKYVKKTGIDIKKKNKIRKTYIEIVSVIKNIQIIYKQ